MLWAALSACAAEKADAPERVYVEAAPLLHGEAQRERLCGRGRSDIVLDVFCAPKRPRIESFTELRTTLGLKTGLEASHSYISDFDGFAFTGHSTSLVARSVSAINPRAIFIRPETEETDLLVMAFARGEQFTETIVRDRVSRQLRFYLTTFEQACNGEPGGCSHGDLLTEAADTGWRSLDVYAEDDLVNTPFDCLTCHQPDGPGTPVILRMQELDPPWNHWLYPYTEGGSALIEDYLAAKDGEAFVSVGSSDVRYSNPGLLSSTLRLTGSQDQPNAYASAPILAEVKASSAARGGNQPEDNSVPGESATWDAIYQRAKRGEAIPVPYPDVKVTDPGKLEAMTAAYRAYREGRIARQELPDIRDVFPDDDAQLARMGFATEPGLDGDGVLHQACAQCHNSRLDQTLSRSRFDVDLSVVPREIRERAIERIMLPADDPRVMPPAILRTLSAEAKQRLVARLRR